MEPLYKARAFGRPGALIEPATPEEIARGDCVGVYARDPSTVLRSCHVPSPAAAQAQNGRIIRGGSEEDIPVVVEFTSEWNEFFESGKQCMGETLPPPWAVINLQSGRIIIKHGPWPYEACVCKPEVLQRFLRSAGMTLPTMPQDCERER